jgi:hypothetical protein
MDLKEQEVLGAGIEDHWYYVAKGRALRALLDGSQVPELLDVGAGSGVFARQMLEHGVCRRAVCVDPNYTEEAMASGQDDRIVFQRSVDSVTQSLILMIDVLEHVPDDLGLLRSYSDRAPPDTLILISVPAFQFLWSGHDMFLEHQRRYTLPELEDLVRRADLQLVRGRYFFASLFPLVALSRLYQQRRLASGKAQAESALHRHPPPINAALTWVHAVESATLFRINRLAGLSAFCLARRP